MNSIEQNVFDVSKPIIEELNLELVEVEMVKEHGMLILRIIIDSPNGINIDDATLVNEKISVLLDELDPIDGEYYLEVSSPGVERELKTREDITKAVGQYVNIKTYEKIPVLSTSAKEIEGTLLSFSDDELIVSAKIKQFNKEIKIPYAKIAKIRLAIRF